MKRTSQVLSKYKLLLVIFILIIVVMLINPSFVSLENLINILDHISINGILAMGMALLMISKSFDLSIGSILVLSGTISVILANSFGVVVGIVVGVLSGVLMGLINGLLVAKLKINSFIATIGTMVIFQGITFWITDMRAITIRNASFQIFATKKIFGIPITIIYFFIAILIIWFISRFTFLGKVAYAIGGNEEVCKQLGIRVDYYKIILFVISGVFASFSGVLLSSKIMAASGIFGENVAMLIIGAIVIGGVSLTGGVGTIIGVVQGIILLGLIDNIMAYVGLYDFYQWFLRSIILIGVVVFDVIYVRQSNKFLERVEFIKIKKLKTKRW